MSLMKRWMLQNTRITAFTISELLRENTHWEEGQITVQLCSQFFETCRYLTKCLFQNKINGTWLLLIKMLKTSWLTSCENVVRLKKISKLHELKYRVQSFSQNENIANTSKKLLKTKYWTFPLEGYFTWNLKFFWNILSIALATRS